MKRKEMEEDGKEIECIKKNGWIISFYQLIDLQFLIFSIEMKFS